MTMKNIILYSGTFETTPWTLDEGGTLTIGASRESITMDLENP